MPDFTMYRYGVQDDPESAPVRGRSGLDQRFFACWYSRVSMGEEYDRRRRELLANLSGTVLEIGPGPGGNLRFLSPDVAWIGLEPNVFMHPHIRAQAAALGREVRIVTGEADAIPLPDAGVDAVVGTLVLCSVTDQDRSLAEVLRVLRPGGRFVFVEHVAAPRGTFVRGLQNAVTPIWRRCLDGCHPNRETFEAIQRAGFERVVGERFALGPLTPHIAGSAVRPGEELRS